MLQFDVNLDAPEAIRAALMARDGESDAQTEAVVRGILEDVKRRGDAAVVEYVRRFDWPDATADGLEATDAEIKAATVTAQATLPALRGAAKNIMAFHTEEKAHLESWTHPFGQGRVLGQRLIPVERVGVYVPGGKADYPSTVLMAAIPAYIAGVSEIIVCTPADAQGRLSPLVLAAAESCANRVFRIGGAPAIAAMAYGTETVPKCDVIVGPGNRYVNTAKRLVYGTVGLDMLAGPSEIAIVADENASPELVAADLLAQTEHGPDNRGWVFSPSSAVLDRCKVALLTQRAQLSRQEILAESEKNLVFVKTNTLEEAADLVNILAPEHLQLMVTDPMGLLPSIRHAGAVLLGEHSSAPLGDYWAGPSHTLPTAGTARFSSPLSVATFLRRSSVIYYGAAAAAEAAPEIIQLADAEGFDGHAQAARLRRSGMQLRPTAVPDERPKPIPGLKFALPPDWGKE